jgi:DNA-binding Xre family transcriptional regulator
MSKPQIIEHEGKPTHVILPIDEYRRLEDQAEDLGDLRAFDDAVAQRRESFPDWVAERLIEGDHPVKVFRAYRKLSLVELARRTGLSKSYLSKIESGGGGSVAAYRLIAEALDMTVDDLIV